MADYCETLGVSKGRRRKRSAKPTESWRANNIPTSTRATPKRRAGPSLGRACRTWGRRSRRTGHSRAYHAAGHYHYMERTMVL